MLLALADRRRKVADTLAAYIADRRDPSHIRHKPSPMMIDLVLQAGSRPAQHGDDREQNHADLAVYFSFGAPPVGYEF